MSQALRSTRHNRTPLKAYLRELRNCPAPLSREDEHSLACEYAAKKDPALRKRLVSSNLRLVVMIAREYHNQASQCLSDLVQEGNFGLLKAVEKYDPSRGVRLTSYAALWIRAYVLKFIMDNFRLARVRQTQAQRKLFYNFRKERARLEAQGIEVTDQVLSEKMSVPARDVAQMRQIMATNSQVSLSAPADHATQLALEDFICAPANSRPDVVVERSQFREALRSTLEEFSRPLSGRELTIFRDRLCADEPVTLPVIGRQYGVTRQRIRQMEIGIVARLRVHLKKTFGDLSHTAMELAQ